MPFPSVFSEVMDLRAYLSSLYLWQRSFHCDSAMEKGLDKASKNGGVLCAHMWEAKRVPSSQGHMEWTCRLHSFEVHFIALLT